MPNLLALSSTFNRVYPPFPAVWAMRKKKEWKLNKTILSKKIQNYMKNFLCAMKPTKNGFGLFVIKKRCNSLWNDTTSRILGHCPWKRFFFFLSHHFYCSLKDSVISDKEYQAVKKFHKLLNLDNLGQLNKLYNFEDTKILTETFEQRSNRLQELFKFNPRKRNSAGSFSRCVHRDKSKCFIALPTNSEHIILFEKP